MKMRVTVALKNGARRFNDIERATEAPNPMALSRCLKRMIREGLVTRVVVDANPPRAEYSLSEIGLALAPSAEGLTRWFDAYGDQIRANRALSKLRAIAGTDDGAAS